MTTVKSAKLQKTAGLLREAIPKMSQLNIPLTPQNYHVWYEYTMGENPELTRAIDRLLDKGEKFTTRVNQELYSNYIHDSPEQPLKEVQRYVQQLVGRLFDRIRGASENTRNFSGSLEKYQGILQSDPDLDTVTSLITDLIDQTEKVLESNKSMENMLESMHDEVDTLRRSLESATMTAYTDKLTGIANRRAFDEEIEELHDLYNDNGQIFSLLLIDIDFFKKFNDTFGHAIGDKVLCYVAGLLEGGVKGDDIVARYGGEEFAVLLPSTDYEGAIAVANNLREKIAAKILVDREEESKSYGHVTVSIGAAVITAPDDTTKLIQRADKALYQAKENGRNRVCGEQDL